MSVDDFDIRSAYSAGFCLTRCWDVLTAENVREVGATRELRLLAKRVAAGDFAPLFDPATYGHLGLCLAEVICHGEPWPVELPGRRPSDAPSFHVARLHCSEPLPFSAYDVLLAALASGRVPEIVSATRLVPVGRERVRQLPLCDGLVVRAGEDPVAAGVRLRSELKDTVTRACQCNYAYSSTLCRGGCSRDSTSVGCPVAWSSIGADRGTLGVDLAPDRLHCAGGFSHVVGLGRADGHRPQ